MCDSCLLIGISSFAAGLAFAIICRVIEHRIDPPTPKGERAGASNG
jgi:hypothetical protein